MMSTCCGSVSLQPYDWVIGRREGACQDLASIAHANRGEKVVGEWAGGRTSWIAVSPRVLRLESLYNQHVCDGCQKTLRGLLEFSRLLGEEVESRISEVRHNVFRQHILEHITQ